MDWHAELARQIATADAETLEKWRALEQAGAYCRPRLLNADADLLWRVQLPGFYGEGASFKEAVEHAARGPQKGRKS